MSRSRGCNALKIVGFGGCMISGYPHNSPSFFDTACKLIENATPQPVERNRISRGNRTAIQAEKYLSEALSFEPDYLVLQFGSVDALCPVRSRNQPASGQPASGFSKHTSAEALAYHARPASAFSHVFWGLKTLIGYLRRIKPVTPLPKYIAAIERMVYECQSAGSTVVVLSPFIYGPRRTARYAATYARALHELRTRLPNMILIDAIEALRKFPKTRILMHDGLHLSELSHQILGAAIANSIIADIANFGVFQ